MSSRPTSERARPSAAAWLVATILVGWTPPVLRDGVAAATAGTAPRAVEVANAEEPSTPPMEPAALATGPYAEMGMLLEKSVFDVDVLRLRVRFGTETAARLRALAEGRSYSKGLASSVAAAALDSRELWARVRFLRGFGFDRLLEGIRDNLARARDAGMIEPATFRRAVEALPEWYGFLEGRGIRGGDVMQFRIRGDTVRTVFRTAGGELLADRTNVDAVERVSIPARYFAPGSDFREGLIRSLLAGK